MNLLKHLGVSTSLYGSAARVIGLPNGSLRLTNKGIFLQLKTMPKELELI